MSASEPERTHATDNKSDGYFGRYYLVVIPLAGTPLSFMILWSRFYKLGQLPLAVQWFLNVLVLVGAIVMIRMFVRRRWRSDWVRPSRGNWWGAFAITFSTLFIAAIVTWFFAHVSTFLYSQHIATTSPERPLTDPLIDSFIYYVWNFLHAVPILELPQALGWEEPPFRYTDHVSRLLLLIYKIVTIGPVIATIILIWRNVRRVRQETKDSA